MPKGKMKETPEDQAVTKKALENSGAALLAFVEGVEDIEERMVELKAQRKAKLDAAKSEGYDPKAIKAVVKRRAETPEQAAARAELGATAELYLVAVTDAENV
jgi:uncharacterized protein (UPF0335 family)